MGGLRGFGYHLWIGDSGAASVPLDDLTTPFSDARWRTEEGNVALDWEEIAEIPQELIRFTDAADHAKRLYLPFYHIAREVVSGFRKYQVALRHAASGWTLTVLLESNPDLNSTAIEPVPHMPRLSFVGAMNDALSPGIIEFQELVREGDKIRAHFMGTDTQSYHALFRAMTDPAAEAYLMIDYETTLALSKRDGSDTYEVVPAEGHSVVNFHFDPSDHEYIYAPEQTDQGHALRQVEWKGAFHQYYQRVDTPHIFRYLPDNFQLARRPGSPAFPQMRATYHITDDNLENIQVSFNYVAKPSTDPARIAAASEALKAFLPSFLPNGVDSPILEPWVATTDSLRYFLRLPGGDFQERNQVAISLSDGIDDTVTLSLTAFQTLLEALVSPVNTLFQGRIEARIEEFQTTFPLHADLTDIQDPAALYDAIIDPSVPSDYKRTLEVRTLPVVFSQSNLAAIEIEFQRGDSVLLLPDQIQLVTQIRLPLKDYVLRLLDAGEYQYRLNLFRPDGFAKKSGWKTETDNILFVSVNVLTEMQKVG